MVVVAFNEDIFAIELSAIEQMKSIANLYEVTHPINYRPLLYFPTPMIRSIVGIYNAMTKPK